MTVALVPNINNFFHPSILFFFFFNDTATTEIYTLSLHDALPIWRGERIRPPAGGRDSRNQRREDCRLLRPCREDPGRSEEHTSELQSRLHLVCRLLLEKKKITDDISTTARTRGSM